MSSQANPFVTTQPGYSSLPSAQYNSDDSDSDGAARRGVRKHNTGKYKKPSIATISSELRKTGRKAGCNRLLIFLLYVITLFSVFSLHRNIYENGGMEEKDVKVRRPAKQDKFTFCPVVDSISLTCSLAPCILVAGIDIETSRSGDAAAQHHQGGEW